MNSWEILGLGPAATAEQVHAAHRRLIRRYHPDRAPTGMRRQYEERAKQINAAKDELLSPSRRHLYRPAPGSTSAQRATGVQPDTARTRVEVDRTPPPEPVPPWHVEPESLLTSRQPSRIQTRSAASMRIRLGSGSVLGVMVIGYFVVLGIALIGWFVTALYPAVAAILAH